MGVVSMGCAGSEEKKKDKKGAPAAEIFSGTHISLHLKCALKEGKTMADLEELYKKEVDVVAKQPGFLMFQIAMTESALGEKEVLLTEKYASAKAHLATNVALAEAGLVEGENGIFATYDFVELKFGLPASEYTEDYKKLLKQFEEVTGHAPVVIPHEFGGWVNKTCVGAEPPPKCIIMTATVGLQEGKTFADMQALYAKEVPVALKTPGCIHFQLEMNEETAKNGTAVLHECYTDGAGHIELNVNLAAAGLVEGPDGIFATYKFHKFVFGMINCEVTEDYQGLFNQFEAATTHKPIVHSYAGTGKVALAGGR